MALDPEAATGGQRADEEAAKFRSFLIGGGIAFIVLVLVQLAFAFLVTPVFADLYSDSDILVRQPQRLIFALSRHGLLAVVLLVVDVALFAIMYLLARRFGRLFLLVPAIVLLLLSLAYVPLMYMPIFDSMTVVN